MTEPMIHRAPDRPLLRLSDADREQAVALLNQAVADGRLSWPEHAERVERVWDTRVQDELAPLLLDLGRATGAGTEPQRVRAVASKIIRRPESGRRIEASSLFGAVFLNLSEARPGEELLVEASSIGGKVVLVVGPDAIVTDEGTATLGKRKVLTSATGGNGPRIRITGHTLMGHLKVLPSSRRALRG
jgi:hypothetical protein